MRVGIIQTRGIGDIVIAAPIAAHFIAMGHEVFWPIDTDFIEPFAYALPNIQFLPVDKSITGINTAEFFIETPKRVLTQLGCEHIHTLYSYLTGYDFGFNELSEAVPFDAYKYAITGVQLSKKWTLKLRRNILREAELFRTLNLDPKEDFIVCHEQGSVYSYNFSQECEIVAPGMRVIQISALTTNFLDWLGVLEHCKYFFSVNSVYLNLVEQLSFECDKFMKLQTAARWTPVMKNLWKYL